jgi:hypothetical protein
MLTFGYLRRRPDSQKPDYLSSEDVARRFHETYERLAPELGYKTREASAVPWEDVPERNRLLMIRTVEDALFPYLMRAGVSLDYSSAHRLA